MLPAQLHGLPADNLANALEIIDSIAGQPRVSDKTSTEKFLQNYYQDAKAPSATLVLQAWWRGATRRRKFLVWRRRRGRLQRMRIYFIPWGSFARAAHHVNTKRMRSSFAFWRARAKAWASSSKPQGIWDPSTVNDIFKSNILTASEGNETGLTKTQITKRDRMRMVQNQKRLKRTLCALRSYLRLKTRTRLKAGQCIERVMRTMQDPRRRKFWAHERTRLIWLMWSRYAKYKLAEREKLPSPTFSIQNDDWDRWVRMRIRMLGLKSHARVVAPRNMLRRYFVLWERDVESKTRFRSNKNLAQKHYVAKLFSRVLFAWRSESMFRARKLRVKEKFFDRWFRFAGGKKRDRTIFEYIQSRQRVMGVCNIITKWHAKMRDKKLHRTASMERFLLPRNYATLRASYALWARTEEHLNTLVSSLRQWKLWTARRISWKMARYAYRERVAKHLMSTCFAAWRENAVNMHAECERVEYEEGHFVDMRFFSSTISREVAWINSTRSRYGKLMQVHNIDDEANSSIGHEDAEDGTGARAGNRNSRNIHSAITSAGPETELHTSVSAGNEARVKALLHKESINVNARDPHGNTALLIASQHHAAVYFRICVMLIQHGADTFVMDTQGRSLVDKCVSPMTRTMLLHHNDRILSGRCTKDELAQKVAQTEDKWKSFSITYKSIWGILCTLMRARARTASAPSLSSIVGPHAAHSFLQQRERLVTTRKFTSIQDILAIDAVHESVIAKRARVLAERKVRDDELIRRGDILLNMRSYQVLNPDFTPSIDLPPIAPLSHGTFEDVDEAREGMHSDRRSLEEALDVTRPLYPEMEDASRERKQLMEIKRVAKRCASIVDAAEKAPNFVRIVQDMKTLDSMPSERKVMELRLAINAQNIRLKDKLKLLNDDKATIQTRLNETKVRKKELAGMLKGHSAIVASTKTRLQKAIADLNALSAQSRAKKNKIAAAIRELDESQQRLRHDIADAVETSRKAEQDTAKLERSIKLNRGKKKEDMIKKQETLRVTIMQLKQSASLMESKISALEEDKGVFVDEMEEVQKEQGEKARLQMRKNQFNTAPRRSARR